MDANDIRRAVTAYYAAVTAGDVNKIASLFSADAVMRDPVGTPAATDDAARRERYARIGVMFESFTMTAQDVIAAGEEAAARWTASGKLRGAGKDVRFDGISTFVFDDAGKMTMMSAYFDMAALIAQVQG